jgi:hypothetical protein
MIIPSNIVVDISSTTSSVISGSLPLIIILFGIGIAFYIARSLITLLPKK